MKNKETLEEAFGIFKKEFPILNKYELNHLLQVARFGVKWQKEQGNNRYSEEEEKFKECYFIASTLNVDENILKFIDKTIKEAKEMEKKQQGYSEEEVYKMIDDFAFYWNYNYRKELNTKEYLVEWFEKFKN